MYYNHVTRRYPLGRNRGVWNYYYYWFITYYGSLIIIIFINFWPSFMPVGFLGAQRNYYHTIKIYTFPPNWGCYFIAGHPCSLSMSIHIIIKIKKKILGTSALGPRSVVGDRDKCLRRPHDSRCMRNMPEQSQPL